MSRAGRKRKIGVERYPGGQIRREPEAPPPALVKRATVMSLMGLAAPEYGTILGLYFLQRTIDGHQYEAGKRFAELRRSYSGCVGGPKPPAAVNLGDSVRNAPIDPESAAGEREAVRQVDILQKYNDAHSALRQAGHGVEEVVIQFCDVPGQTPMGHEGLIRLRKGLGALSVLWKIRSK